jgi:hypothetical protein
MIAIGKSDCKLSDHDRIVSYYNSRVRKDDRIGNQCGQKWEAIVEHVSKEIGLENNVQRILDSSQSMEDPSYESVYVYGIHGLSSVLLW